ncbi:MAG: hypothetical protein FWC62_02485 [Firmicutes bacterium]|nr:hypothetical protein [Bacillota bacterium]
MDPTQPNWQPAPPPYGTPPYGYVPPPPVYAAPEIDGVPTSAIAGFVGKKAPYYIRKFAELDRNHSKTSFNAAVFFLTLFLGPVIGSLWFFYRRLNKLGAVLLSIGVVVTAAHFLLMALMMRQLTLWLNELTSALSGARDATFPFISAFPRLDPYYGISLLVSAVSVAAAIVFGIFANGWYKNHVLSSLKTMSAEPDGITQTKLLSRGGTRAAAWVTVLVVYVVVSFTLTGILMSGFWTAFMDYMRQVINSAGIY